MNSNFEHAFETSMHGHDCTCVVTEYSSGKPWEQHTFPGAGPGDCDLPEPPEFEYSLVFDAEASLAAELDQMPISQAEEDRLLKEFLALPD